MTLVLRYAVRSDVGLLREGNEDSAYAGPRLLAVADGMGGHAAGEVASSLTIASMAKLDSEPPGGDMLAELAAAVAAANTRLQEMIIANPAVEGMGTTLTALFWSDGHAAVWRTSDAGSSWRKLDQGLPHANAHVGVLREGMAIDSYDVPGLYFGTSTGQVFASADEGESWAEIASYLPAISSVEVAVLD